MPNLLAGYNSYFQIFQSADHVVVFQELIHDARVIPIDDSSHLVAAVRQLHGDSRGHWVSARLLLLGTLLDIILVGDHWGCLAPA